MEPQLQVAPLRGRLPWATKEAWKPLWELGAAILGAAIMAAWSRSMTNFWPTIGAAVGLAFLVYLLRFAWKLWESPAALAREQFADLERSYVNAAAKASQLDGFLDSTPRITRVSLSKATPRDGYFDLLVDVWTTDATAIGDWRIEMEGPSGASVNLVGDISTHGLREKQYSELTVSFPLTSLLGTRTTLRNAKVVRLAGLDAQRRPVIYSPREPVPSLPI